MKEVLLASLGRYIPEVIVIITMMFLLYLESAYSNDETKKKYMPISAGLGLLIAFITLIANMKLQPTGIFYNAVVIDPFSTMLKITMVLGAMGVTYLSYVSMDIYEEMKGEFLIMAMGILAGGMLLASANNMITIYLGLETLSILSYVMASFKKRDGRSTEAGLKYVLYGGVASGVMLFGMSHIYGIVGSIQLFEITQKLSALSSFETGLLVPSFILMFAGVGYKIACVPFHMWSPDVYEGSPLPVTTFFAMVPKIAGIAILVRISMTFFGASGDLQNIWVGLLTVVSALTMSVGNITAIGQKSVKRMLAFSSIAHAGVLIAGVSVLNQLGNQSVLFYTLTYVFMTLVSFYVVGFVSDMYGNDHFDRFNGLIYKHPFMAIMLTITMFSLAGIPPFSGYIAKFNIFLALIESGNYTLAIVTGINSIISVYYYMKIVRFMVFKSPEGEEPVQGFSFLNQLIICGLTVPVVFLGLFWEGIIKTASGAGIFLQ